MEQQIAVCSRTAPHDAAVGLPSPQEGEGAMEPPRMVLQSGWCCSRAPLPLAGRGAMEPPRMVLQSGSPPPCGEGRGVGAAS
jgi:hypothetical protein